MAIFYACVLLELYNFFYFLFKNILIINNAIKIINIHFDGSIRNTKKNITICCNKNQREMYITNPDYKYIKKGETFLVTQQRCRDYKLLCFNK